MGLRTFTPAPPNFSSPTFLYSSFVFLGCFFALSPDLKPLISPTVIRSSHSPFFHFTPPITDLVTWIVLLVPVSAAYLTVGLLFLANPSYLSVLWSRRT